MWPWARDLLLNSIWGQLGMTSVGRGHLFSGSRASQGHQGEQGIHVSGKDPIEKKHVWVLFLSTHGFSLSESQLWLVGGGCLQLSSYQGPHRETVVNQFYSQFPEREKEADWVSLGQVSTPGTISCGQRWGWGIGHSMAVGIIPMVLALEVGVPREGEITGLWTPQRMFPACAS